MIISHRHKFIFLKTRKTAGTSVELALRQVLGPDDVATPLSPTEERFAKINDIGGPRNYLKLARDIEIKQVPQLVRSIKTGFRTGKQPPRIPIFNPYRQHLNAHKARHKVGISKWHDYFKFTIERNPWDRTVSYYRWICRRESPPPSFSDFVSSGRSYPYETNYSIYSIKGLPAVDYWVRYEQLVEDLEEVAHILDLPVALGSQIQRIWAKSRLRQRAHYVDYYSSATRRMVALQFANEIALMGYTFEGGVEEP